jgi:hypothetical protein
LPTYHLFRISEVAPSFIYNLSQVPHTWLENPCKKIQVRVHLNHLSSVYTLPYLGSVTHRQFGIPSSVIVPQVKVTVKVGQQAYSASLTAGRTLSLTPQNDKQRRGMFPSEDFVHRSCGGFLRYSWSRAIYLGAPAYWALKRGASQSGAEDGSIGASNIRLQLSGINEMVSPLS